MTGIAGLKQAWDDLRPFTGDADANARSAAAELVVRAWLGAHGSLELRCARRGLDADEVADRVVEKVRARSGSAIAERDEAAAAMLRNQIGWVIRSFQRRPAQFGHAPDPEDVPASADEPLAFDPSELRSAFDMTLHPEQVLHELVATQRADSNLGRTFELCAQLERGELSNDELLRELVRHRGEDVSDSRAIARAQQRWDTARTRAADAVDRILARRMRTHELQRSAGRKPDPPPATLNEHEAAAIRSVLIARLLRRIQKSRLEALRPTSQRRARRNV